MEKVLEYKEIKMEYYEHGDVIRNKITILQQEVAVLKSRIQEHGTGHIHTAIGVITHRITELEEEFIEAQKQRNR